MKCSENRKELVSEIRSLAQSQGLNTVFTTFLEIAANSLAAFFVFLCRFGITRRKKHPHFIFCGDNSDFY